MLNKLKKWLKKSFIGTNEEKEEVCETALLSEEEREEVIKNAEKDIWEDA